MAEFENGVYKNEQLNWKMIVKDGWKSIPQDHRDRWTQLATYKMTTPNVRDNFKHLVGLYKGEDDIWNCMISNMEPSSNYPFDVTEELMQKYYAESLELGFKNMKISNLHFTTFTDVIGKHVFNRLNVDLIDDQGKVVFSQMVYLKYMKGYVLEVIISYNNEADKIAMLNMFLSSTF